MVRPSLRLLSTWIHGTAQTPLTGAGPWGAWTSLASGPCGAGSRHCGCGSQPPLAGGRWFSWPPLSWPVQALRFLRLEGQRTGDKMALAFAAGSLYRMFNRDAYRRVCRLVVEWISARGSGAFGRSTGGWQ